MQYLRDIQAKEIELRARMKFSDVSLGNIGLMLRIDGSSGILGFENMYEKNIQGTKEWSTYTVKIPYPTGAKTIFIGAILGELAGYGSMILKCCLMERISVNQKFYRKKNIRPMLILNLTKVPEFKNLR